MPLHGEQKVSQLLWLTRPNCPSRTVYISSPYSLLLLFPPLTPGRPRGGVGRCGERHHVTGAARRLHSDGTVKRGRAGVAALPSARRGPAAPGPAVMEIPLPPEGERRSGGSGGTGGNRGNGKGAGRERRLTALPPHRPGAAECHRQAGAVCGAERARVREDDDGEAEGESQILLPLRGRLLRLLQVQAGPGAAAA